MRKLFLRFLIHTLIAFAVVGSPLVHAETPAVPESPLLITELQTAPEFLEVYNRSDHTVDLTNWKFEYITSTGGTTTNLPMPTNKYLAARSFVLLSLVSSNLLGSDGTFTNVFADAGGSIKIHDKQNTFSDVVGWGTATIFEAAVAPKPVVATPSIKRLVNPDDARFIDTNSNVNDFTLSAQPSPQGGGVSATDPDTPIETPVPPAPSPQDPAPNPTIPPAQCQGAILSEVLPNPAGSDTSGEFIELYNPTIQAQSLEGCSLKTSATGKQYSFAAGTVLTPGEYRAFPYTTTGLQLTNSGGEVWLVTSSQETVITYPNSGDDQAWAWIDDGWHVTYEPTPNVANALYVPTSTTSTSGEILEPCPEGKYRNPETNRCKTVEVETAAKACDPGEERNPSTNRCRSIAATLASLVPCQEGYERNAETNRCRKVDVLASTVKPCPAGQERNLETNRCRKTITAINAASIAKDAQKTPQKIGQNIKIMAGVLALAGAYGVYEYRKDLANGVHKFRSRFDKHTTSK